MRDQFTALRRGLLPCSLVSTPHTFSTPFSAYLSQLTLLHRYGCTDANPCSVDDDLKAFKTQMTNAISTCNGKPIWITEFQKIGSMDDQQSFVTQAIDWLEQPAQAKIERYSYFMVTDGILTNGGSLSNVGTAYAST